MNLSIKLKARHIPSQITKIITNYVIQQNNQGNPDLHTWEAEEVILNTGIVIIGFRNAGQFNDMGWTQMIAYRDLIQVYYVHRIGAQRASEEQIAMVLFRFATMLRNHFGKYIYSIALNGL